MSWCGEAALVTPVVVGRAAEEQCGDNMAEERGCAGVAVG